MSYSTFHIDSRFQRARDIKRELINECLKRIDSEEPPDHVRIGVMIGEVLHLLRPAVQQTWSALARRHGAKMGYPTIANVGVGIELPRSKHVFGVNGDTGSSGFINEPKFRKIKNEFPQMYDSLLGNLAFYFKNEKKLADCLDFMSYIKERHTRRIEPFERDVIKFLSAQSLQDEGSVLSPLFVNEWMFWVYEANDFDKHLNVNWVDVSSSRFRHSEILTSNVRVGWRGGDESQGYGHFISFTTEDNIGDARNEYEPPCFIEELGCFLVKKKLTMDDEMDDRQKEIVRNGGKISRTSVVDYTFEFRSGQLKRNCTGYLSELLIDGIDKTENFVNDLQGFL